MKPNEEIMTQNQVELKCYCCQSSCKDSDSFCGVCGYPFKGTTEEQKEYSLNYSINKFEKGNVTAKIKEARIILFVLAFFTFLMGAIIGVSTKNPSLLIINFILAIIYASLGSWAKKKAFAAIFVGLLIYISVILLNGILEPSTIISGIVFKIIFTVALVRAAYGSYKFRINEA
jgi:hypothetical protein